jgi:3-dehydroquinate synthase
MPFIMAMQDLAAAFSVPVRFPVRFTRHAWAADNAVLDACMPGSEGRPARAMVVLDDGLLAADPGLTDRIQGWFRTRRGGPHLAAQPLVVPGGEAAKADWAVVDRVMDLAAELQLCRHSYVVAIGGGALLDAVGLGATLVHRGLRLIRMPSTTLGQCDAGLGVKNAINAYHQKNFLGTFQAPWAVVDDLALLDLQDDRSWRAGISEAVKVGIIKDAAFVHRLAELAAALAARSSEAMAESVHRCAALHLDHICTAGDPFESGSSRPLDFGHWVAHRLEILTRHRLLHGEAVAVGVGIDCAYAVEQGWLAEADGRMVAGILAQVGLPLWDAALDLRDGDGRRTILGGLEQFRAHLGGGLTLAMPDGLGRRQDVHAMDEIVLERALARMLVWRRQVGSGSPVVPVRS